MDMICDALIESIIYISGRETPDDIADDDVQFLEHILAALGKLSKSQKDELVEAAITLKSDSDDIARRQELDAFIESISAI